MDGCLGVLLDGAPMRSSVLWLLWGPHLHNRPHAVATHNDAVLTMLLLLHPRSSDLLVAVNSEGPPSNDT